MASDFSIDRIMGMLLLDIPFFASYSRFINKIRDENTPTASACYNARRKCFEIRYNPTFFSTMTKEEIKAVLIHEFYHIMLGHVSGRSGDGSSNPKSRLAWNLATDAEINSHISNLPSREDFKPIYAGQGLFEGIGPAKGSEVYNLFLLKKYPQLSEDAHSFDCHNGWGTCSESGEELSDFEKFQAGRLNKKLLTKANVESQGGWGNLPEEIRRQLEALFNPKIDWKRALSYFVQKTQRGQRRNSYRRVNRRLPYKYPGAYREKTARVLIAIDQSGSVSDELIGKFFSELRGLSKTTSFDYVFFDTKLGNIRRWDRGRREDPERLFTGGTCFTPAVEYAAEEDYDGLIIATDLEAPVPERNKISRIWIAPPGAAEKMSWPSNETVLEVD